MVLRFFLLFGAVIGFLPGADFVSEIHPILASRCLSCHSGAKPQAGLDLSKKAGADKVLDVLITRVEGRAGRVMPPIGKPLEAKQIELLKSWIAEGAPWVDVDKSKMPDWEAPLAPRQPPVPAGRGNPIDRFLGQPSKGVAGDSTFARRAFLDLWSAGR
jgi:hypothetical protein